MRLWSLHTKYLDSKGLVALWREALLAKAVLEGKTAGYQNHPQLNRFRETVNPKGSINKYLEYVYMESVRRGYSFDSSKIAQVSYYQTLTVTTKQIEFELEHLLRKLKARNKQGFDLLSAQGDIDTHPLFNIIQGEVEDWERQ